MKKTEFIILLFALAAGSLFPAVVHAGPSIRFDSEVHDFGTVREGEVLECSFELSNTGDEDLMISGLTPS
jgi:hypothetical protein